MKVILDFLVAEVAECHQRRYSDGARCICGGVVETEAGKEVDGLPAHGAQLLNCAVVGTRFAIDFAVEYRNLIAADDQTLREILRDRFGFFFGKPESSCFWGLSRKRGFVGIRCGRDKGNAKTAEQFTAEWRGGSEDEGGAGHEEKGKL